MLSTAPTAVATPRAAETPDHPRRVGVAVEPAIIVVAPPPNIERLRPALTRVGARLVELESADQIRDHISPETVAIVLGDAVDPSRVVAAMESLGAQGPPRQLPVFVIGRDETPQEDVASFYEAGAAAVFAWPREALAMAPILVEMLDATLAVQEDRSVDESIQDVITARLQFEDMRDVTVHVHNRRVSVRTTVQSSWERQRLASMVAAIPGVRSVDASSIRVEVPLLPDEELEGHVMDVLRSASGTHPSTLAVSVDSGKVTIAGTVATRGELERVENVIHNLAGVREVRNLVSVSRRAAIEGRKTAQELQTRLAKAYPDARSLRASCFGGVVVLEGVVSSASDRDTIAGHVRHRYDVDRVVNKIEIR